MRVLHVIPAVAARYGGPSVVALESCRALLALGVDVVLATTDADGEHELDVPLNTEATFAGVPAVFFRRAASEGYKWSPRLASWLATHAGAFDVVDVHAVFSHSSIAAGRAAQTLGIPYVVRPHGTLDPWSLSRKSWRKQLLLEAGARRLLQRARRIQYTTAEEMRLAEQALPWLPQGVVVPLGVEEACFEEGSTDRNDQAPYVLVMSRLEEKKNLELFVDVFHAVCGTGAFAQWRLIVAGEGSTEYVGRLRAHARVGPAADRIEFRGWVSGQVKHDLLRGASLFASPSFQENFGLSLAEAMASQVPVLISPGVNLAPDIERAAAGWVVELTADAMREALEAILQDSMERHRRGACARVLAQQFRWSTHARALVALYRGLVPHTAAAEAV